MVQRFCTFENFKWSSICICYQFSQQLETIKHTLVITLLPTKQYQLCIIKVVLFYWMIISKYILHGYAVNRLLCIKKNITSHLQRIQMLVMLHANCCWLQLYWVRRFWHQRRRPESHPIDHPTPYVCLSHLPIWPKATKKLCSGFPDREYLEPFDPSVFLCFFFIL